ncbi:MAG: ABC transporter ATP-binding protein [Paludibacteraceae bacterium]|nr:ABC transporter ATP-binding protein [Paludibacteraceae bacterium]MBN2787926.1 ABC transporter ATP-binding protein [Paludibacteraceae bacterium]
MILSTKSLSIGYKKTCIQQHLNLQIRTGEMICLIGPNGCGKSTLLRTLCGLQKPISGSFELKEKDFKLLTTNEKALLFAFVLTDKVSIDNMTVVDLVFTGRYPHTTWLGNRTKKDKLKVDEAIDMVHLSHKKNSFINELSDGEKQRVMIAKALAQDTALIFLDEPSSHLDLPNRVDIMLLLHRLAKETNKAIVLSTHELDLAIQTADKLWLMHENGVETGEPDSMKIKILIEKTFASNSVEIDSTTGNFKLKI